jgi:hypothetical protein
MKDKVTNVAGAIVLLGFLVNQAVKSGLVPAELAPVADAGATFATALVAWYTGKPVR